MSTHSLNSICLSALVLLIKKCFLRRCSCAETLARISSVPKKKNKWYVQGFNIEWLACPEFQDWLEPVDGDRYSARCTTCDSTFKKPNKSTLIKHMNSAKHKKSIIEPNGGIPIAAVEQSHDAKVAESELSIAGFFAEHNIPFAVSDHFKAVCQKAFPDSAIAKDISEKRTKMNYVIQDGITFHEKLSLNAVCQI